MNRATVIAVRDETHNAQHKHNFSIEERDSIDRLVAILAEETGEVAEAAMDYADAPSVETLTHLKHELVQVMSVAARWYERIA